MNCKKCGKEIPEGKELCAECEKQEALESSADIQPVTVGNEKKGLSKKTIGIIIGVCVAVAIAVVALILVFSGSSNGGNEESSVREYYSLVRGEDGSEKTVLVTEMVPAAKDPNNQNKDNNADNNNAGNQQNTTKKPETVPAQNPNKIGNEVKEPEVKVDNKVQKSLTAFFSGKFYYDGIMYAADGSATKLKMAVNGSDIEAVMYDSGMNINMGFMQLDGKTYIVNTDNKQYLEFTAELGEMFGIDMNELKLGDLTKLFSAKKSTPDAQYSTTVNGKNATCYEYVSDDKSTSTKFYFVGDELVEMDQANADGTNESKTMISQFSYSIPSDMLSLNGLTPASSLMAMFPQ